MSGPRRSPTGIEQAPDVLGPHLRALNRTAEPERVDPLGSLPLGYVDLQVLLKDVLDRVVELLDVDTAVVLLVDASGQEVVARAARGLEEEVRQGVRVRVGEGFAGRVVASRQPLFLDQVDESTVSNPILWRRGIRTMLGVPLLANDQVIGVLHVGSFKARPFSDRDATVLGLIADRVAAAVRDRLIDADRDAAEAIQRSLVPSVPARLAAFECAARYVPAESGGLGGDWYDLFQLEDETIWLIVGDVAGHGLHAARVMGRLRSTLRAYAVLGGSPDEVFAMADRKMNLFDIGQMATVAVAAIPSPFDHALVALAGHLPFAIARPGRECELVEAPPGPPLGIRASRPEPIAVELPLGTVIVGCTDGLIERRHESLDVGLERLRSAIRPQAPKTVCETVIAIATEGYVPEDDIALIALRHAPDNDCQNLGSPPAQAG